MVWYMGKERPIEQKRMARNRPVIYGQLISDKCTKVYKWKKNEPFKTNEAKIITITHTHKVKKEL